MANQDILYTKEESIATITFNRPDKMNSYTPEMIVHLYNALEDATKDKGVRVVVITGTGRAFCTGGDVKAMAERSYQVDKELTEKELEAEEKYPVLLQRLEKPVIASINGVAVGAGLDLACACDIRIASDRARFAELFIRRGLIPAMGGTFFLPRLVGIDKACQLIWTGDMIDAREAERIGLVTMVVPHDELGIATTELAEKLAKGPPLAIQRAKRAIYEGLKMDLPTTMKYVDRMIKELYRTEDHKEGARAFVEKREPVFRGE